MTDQEHPAVESRPYLESDIAEAVEHLGDTCGVFAGKTILLTGGNGFLGRYWTALFEQLNRRRLWEPTRLLLLDNFIVGDAADFGTIENDHCRLIQHDVIEPFDCDEPIDYVVHAAGIASPYYYRAFPLETLEVATTGTKNMLELARRKGARLLFFSSSEIYGDPDAKHVPTPESYRGNVASQGPRACYDEGKRVGETLCYVYHNYFGLACNAVRPFNVYGPGMHETDYRILPNFASRIKAGKPINIYGTGAQTRTYCYISDAICGFARVLAKGTPGETYNIGSPTPEISVNDLATLLASVLDREIDANHIEYPDSYPADEPTRRCPDIRKARLQLGYEPHVELREGLKRFLDWTDRSYTGTG